MRCSSILAACLFAAACGQPSEVTANAASANAIDDVREAAPAISETGKPASDSSPPTIPASSSPEAEGQDKSNAGIHDVLRDVLVAVGQIDGVRITAVTQRSRCLTAFATAGGLTVVDWTRVGDFQARIDKGRVLIPVATGGEQHVFSTPEDKQPEPVGDAADRMEMGFGSLVDRCAER